MSRPPSIGLDSFIFARVNRIGWVMIVAAIPALGLVKLEPYDVPWHLATGRLAAQTGVWPIENTFSWTYPHHPLLQQYPLFQGLIYRVYLWAGWSGLSVLVCLGWVAAAALFVRWGGPFAGARPFHTVWALVLVALQPRVALRPDMTSLALFAGSLLAFDAYRRGRPRAIVAIPVLHWLWVNTHQLFVLSFALQAIFVLHLLVVRARRGGVDPTDASVPIGPVAVALGASLAVSALGPLGPRILGGGAVTANSFIRNRAHIDEFAPVWSDPMWLATFGVLLLMSGGALWRARRNWVPLELGVWLLTLALALAASRGVPYFALASGAIVQRALSRAPPGVTASEFFRRGTIVILTGITAVLASSIVLHRWVTPPTARQNEPGLGRWTVGWPDAAVARLKTDPPPGPMMNMPWSTGGALDWLWPEQRVFVDGRGEAYPRDFFDDVTRSYGDDAVLERLLATWAPGWILVDHCSWGMRARVAHLLRGRAWQLTYADAQMAVLVRDGAATAAYRARHPFVPAVEPPDLVPAPGPLRDHQRDCYARMLAVARAGGGAGMPSP